MNTQDIKAIIADITRRKWMMEEALEENGGELTPELLDASSDIEDLKAALREDGVDDLGRMLKTVQDEIAARKAEADAAARKVKNLKGYEDYLKTLIGEALDAIGKEKVKGSFYGFTRTTSMKTSVLTEALDDAYLEAATEAARNAGLPPYVDVALVTNCTRIREYAQANDLEGAQFLWEDITPALRFTKPRSNSKKEDA